MAMWRGVSAAAGMEMVELVIATTLASVLNHGFADCEIIKLCRSGDRGKRRGRQPAPVNTQRIPESAVASQKNAPFQEKHSTFLVFGLR